MLMLLIPAMIVVISAAAVGLRGRDEGHTSTVGVDPGNIRGSHDIVASAHKRGHSLAIFAAG